MHREVIRARYFKTHLTGFGVRLQSVFLVSCGVLSLMLFQNIWVHEQLSLQVDYKRVC